MSTMAPLLYRRPTFYIVVTSSFHDVTSNRLATAISLVDLGPLAGPVAPQQRLLHYADSGPDSSSLVSKLCAVKHGKISQRAQCGPTDTRQTRVTAGTAEM